MAVKAKKVIKKVVKGLKKASKLHAGQAKSLSTIKLSKGGVQSMLQVITRSQPCVKRYSTELKQVVREVLPVNGQPEKHK